jgi:Protein of unknown function (DUF4197)
MPSRRLAAIQIAVATFALSVAHIAHAQLGEKDAASGIRTALERGASVAIDRLGVTGGFSNNPQVRIPLPDSLKKAQKAAKFLGLDQQFNELESSMNQAAEAAVPQARALLVSAVKQMSVKDALGIVSGGEGSATNYFRRVSGQAIHAKFMPIVIKATDKVGLKQRYNSLAAQGSKLGLLKENQSSLDGYVTGKAVDGLFLMIAEEEKAIRKDPIGTGSAILRKVFGR